MSRLDDLLESCAADLEACGEKADPNLLRAVAKACGPAVYLKGDARLVSSDAAELQRVRSEFLLGKLGLKDSEKLEAGLKAVKKRYKKKNKLRVAFYYLLVKEFRKRSALLP